jgi:hypothetical protein
LAAWICARLSSKIELPRRGLGGSMSKSETVKGAVYAALIGAVGTVAAALLGLLHFGPESDDLRFPVSVLDNLTNAAIDDASVDLGIPDLSPSRTDSGGKDIFKLSKRLIGKTAMLTVQKSGYEKYTEQLFSLHPQDNWHTVYLNALLADRGSPRIPSITNSAPVSADYAALRIQFDKGIGPFLFGMSPSKVNSLLPRRFGTVAWANLPVAGEYKTAEVRYLWVPLSEFQKDGPGVALYSALPAFHPCWGGQSYITFQFASQVLVHISVRLLADCASHAELLQTFAAGYAISSFNISAPRFEVELNNVTLIGLNGSDESALDVFLANSPRT